MQQYKYTAVNLEKQKFSGIFTAQDEHDLATQLAKQNLFLISSTPYSGKTPSAFFTTGTGKIKNQELSMFCSQFSIMLVSGVPVLESLESLKDQPFSAYFKSILKMIYDDVRSGIMLSKAIDKHKKAFPDFFCSMIYVGEASGNLEKVFNSLAEYYERDTEIKRKTKSAFSYPVMLGCMTVGIVILMLLFVVPSFKGTLSDLDVRPTGITAVVFGISNFLVKYWLYALAVIAVIGIGIFAFLKTETGSSVADKIKITLPVIKNVQIDLFAARFARSFSILLASGMDVASALDKVSIIIGNKALTKKYNLAVEDIKHGAQLSDAFERYNIFPQIMIQMIAIGEKTASLESVLQKSCSYFDERVETTLESVTSKIQPIMLIVMGAVIGTMFIAVYSPMISIMTQIV